MIYPDVCPDFAPLLSSQQSGHHMLTWGLGADLSTVHANLGLPASTLKPDLTYSISRKNNLETLTMLRKIQTQLDQRKLKLTIDNFLTTSGWQVKISSRTATVGAAKIILTQKYAHTLSSTKINLISEDRWATGCKRQLNGWSRQKISLHAVFLPQELSVKELL